MIKVWWIVLVVLPAMALAQVPHRLRYQGRLLKGDGSTPEVGIKQIGFALFSSSNGGSALWGESQKLALTDGYYTTDLGMVTPLSAAEFGSDLWLEISVDGVPLAPRMPLSSAPFSLVSENVSGGTVYASSATVAGSVGIAVRSPAAQLHVLGAAPKASNPGTVGINGSDYATLAGAGTSFKQSGIVSGDVILVTTAQKTVYDRIVTEVVDDATLKVNMPFPTNFSGASYTFEKPIARLDTSNGATRFLLNGRGILVLGGSLSFGSSGYPYPDNWIGVADNIDGDSRWLHIGGITSAKSGEQTAYRRTAYVADRHAFFGAVGIGTATPDSSLHVPQGAHFNAIAVGMSYPGYTTAWPYETIALPPNTNLRLNFGSTNPFIFQNSGTALAASWSTSSDERLKTHIQPIAEPRSKALALRGVTFDWKSSGRPSVGFIAQEVEKVLPEIVSTDPQGFKAIDYARLTPFLVEAFKEHEAELRRRQQDVDALRSENRALERRLSELENALKQIEKRP